jgi:hypothetical protein
MIAPDPATMGRMSDGVHEARTAAAWWAALLTDEDAGSSIGDPMSDAFIAVERALVARPSPEQVERFRVALEQRLLAEIVHGDPTWQQAVEVGNPQFGSALRCVEAEYGPDRIIDGALLDAGIDGRDRRLLFPFKTLMWFNPGEVTVRGSGPNPDITIWRAAEAVHD